MFKTRLNIRYNSRDIDKIRIVDMKNCEDGQIDQKFKKKFETIFEKIAKNENGKEQSALQ